MGRNADADRFVDCVVGRGRYDSVTRTTLLLASMLVPAIFGAAIALLASSRYPDVFDPGRDAALAVAMIVSIECGMISFILLFMSRRSKRHMRRDMEWMSSLCDYVDSIGGDSAEMRRLAGKADMLGAKIDNGASMAIWAFTALFICAVGALSYSDADVLGPNVRPVCAACYVLLLAQYLLTAGSVSRFPSKHDMAQCDFTKALARELRSKGILIDPMKRSTGGLHPVVSTALFIVTLGLSSLAMIVVSNIRFNNHIKGQWKYEEKVMEALMKAQGASGLEGCRSERNWYILYFHAYSGIGHVRIQEAGRAPDSHLYRE